jgi:hypothetical protein
VTGTALLMLAEGDGEPDGDGLAPGLLELSVGSVVQPAANRIETTVRSKSVVRLMKFRF